MQTGANVIVYIHTSQGGSKGMARKPDSRPEIHFYRDKDSEHCEMAVNCPFNFSRNRSNQNI